MGLVDHIDLGAQFSRAKLHALDQLTGILNRGVRGGVHFDHVDGAPLRNLLTGRALATGPTDRLGKETVDGLRQQASHTRLPHASWTGEEVGMGHTPLDNGVAQRLYDMLLTDELGEGLRAPFAVE